MNTAVSTSKLKILEAANNVASKDTFTGSDSTFNNVIDVPTERKQLLNAIQILRTLEDDWNGFGASAPHPKALNTAQKFIDLLPFGRKFPNKIYPASERSVVMEWTGTATSGDILITFEPYLLGAVKVFENGDVEDLGNFSLLPDTVCFPQAIRSLLPEDNQ